MSLAPRPPLSSPSARSSRPAFAPRTARQREPPGEMLIHHLEGSIVASTGAGHCGVSLVEAVASAAPELLAAVPGACWLIDLARVNGADVGCHRPGSEIFRLFRERGGRALALVVPSNTLRMVITAGAFAAGISFKVFDQRATALAYLRDLEARPAARPAA